MNQDMLDLGDLEPARKRRGEGERVTREAKEKPLVYERVRTVAKPKCVRCVAQMEQGKPWFAPDPVAYVRKARGHPPEPLCYRHTQEAREADGMEPIKPKRD